MAKYVSFRQRVLKLENVYGMCRLIEHLGNVDNRTLAVGERQPAYYVDPSVERKQSTRAKSCGDLEY